MKKKKVLQIVLALVVLAAVGIMLLVYAAPKHEPEKKETVEQAEIAPLIIENQDKKSAKVTICHDGEMVYEYDGPIELKRKDGKYLIEVQTFSCLCYGE